MLHLHGHPHRNHQHRRQRPQSHLQMRTNHDKDLLLTTHHLQRQRMGNKRKMRFPNPCLDCGTLSLGNRCPTHQQAIDEQAAQRRAAVKASTGQYSGNYTKLARIIRQTTITCALCGQGARPNDPWQADHKQPGTPVHSLDQLQGVHATCNRTRSNKPLT